jgi:hypothetical protein
VYAGIHLYLHLPAFYAYAYAYSYTNSASSVANRDCDFDSYTQAKPHSETSHDTEAAPESAAKARRSESMIS